MKQASDPTIKKTNTIIQPSDKHRVINWTHKDKQWPPPWKCTISHPTIKDNQNNPRKTHEAHTKLSIPTSNIDNEVKFQTKLQF